MSLKGRLDTLEIESTSTMTDSQIRVKQISHSRRICLFSVVFRTHRNRRHKSELGCDDNKNVTRNQNNKSSVDINDTAITLPRHSAQNQDQNHRTSELSDVSHSAKVAEEQHSKNNSVTGRG